jgi:hypothetical protein
LHENPDALHIVILPNAGAAALVTKLKQMLAYSHTLTDKNSIIKIKKVTFYTPKLNRKSYV